MSSKYPGGIISKTAPTPSGPYSNDTAPGIWTLEQQAYWQKLGQWPNANNPPLDPQFNYVTMLLHGDGTNGAQNNTFLDGSTNNFTITRSGNTTQGSFSPYGSNWSNNFNGTTAYLQVANNAAFDFGSGDFTIEFWMNASTLETGTLQPIINKGTDYASEYAPFDISREGTDVKLWLGTAGPTWGIVGGASIGTIVIGQWSHFAVTRSGTTFKAFQNGVQTWTTTSSDALLVNTFPLRLAATSNAGSFFNGYLSNVRLVKGTAVYTSAFTPSTTPLTAISGTSVLTCQSNRFVDNSANAFAITVTGAPTVQRFNPFGTATVYSTSVIGGSGYFDGVGDYLQIANNTALDVGTGAFTLEGWMYRTSVSFSDWRMFGPTATNGGFFGGRAGKLGLGRSAVAWDLESSTNVYNNDAWTHVVYVRNGSGNLSIFSNGTRVATTTNSNNYGLSAGNLQIGAEKNSELFGGFLSNTRLVKGTAVYDPTQTTLTVPTAPLTAVSGTGYLGFFTNGAIFDNAMMNDLETVGNAQISTSVKKYGTGSISFDGTDDRLVQSGSPQIAFGTADFTVECWIYSLDVSDSTQRGFLQTSATAGGLSASFSEGITFVFGTPNGTGTINAIVGGTNYASSGGTVTTSTWYHIAVTRASGDVKLFVNGTSVASGTGNTTNLSGQFICVGGYYDTSYLYNGYIDDLRITKGYARYTANFTPPTQAFFNYGPT
jgi:hypothetical protein